MEQSPPINSSKTSPTSFEVNTPEGPGLPTPNRPHHQHNHHNSPEHQQQHTQLHCPNHEKIRTPESACRFVSEKVRAFGKGDVSDPERKAIRQATFSNWDHDESKLIIYIRQMYKDLGLVERLPIDIAALDGFLLRVFANYNRVPFHNFNHCFMVAQMTYAIIWLGELDRVCSDIELLALLTAAVCHDLDHPGLSNYYQRCAATKIAADYKESPLENHHVATARQVLADPTCDILAARPELRADFETIMERLILATDMARHGEIVADFETTLNAASGRLDLGFRENRDRLLRIVVKAADVSNEARPMGTAERWIDCLLREFFAEARLESESGIRPLPFMDPGKVRKASSQCDFIGSVVLPLVRALARVLPGTEAAIVAPVENQLQFYIQQLSVDQSELDAGSS